MSSNQRDLLNVTAAQAELASPPITGFMSLGALDGKLGSCFLDLAGTELTIRVIEGRDADGELQFAEPRRLTLPDHIARELVRLCPGHTD